MSDTTGHAPCGCTFKARDTGESLAARSVSLWEFHHCPLHGAAGELREACKAAAMLLAISQLPHCDKRMASNETLIQGALDALNIALALAEPKPSPAVAYMTKVSEASAANADYFAKRATAQKRIEVAIASAKSKRKATEGDKCTEVKPNTA